MISRQQADTIAQELVQHERDSSERQRNERAAKVPHFYRYPELESFPLWRRAGVLRDAMQLADGTWPVVLSGAGGFAALLGGFLFLPSLTIGEHFGALTVLGFCAICVAPLILAYRIQVRRQLREMLGAPPADPGF